MMDHPPQRRLDHRQPSLLHRRLNNPQGLKRGILEIPLPIQPPHRAHGITVPPLAGDVRGLVFPGEDTAGDGVVSDVVEAETTEDGKEFFFGGAGEGVVHSWRDRLAIKLCLERERLRTLVESRSDPSVVLCDKADFGDLRRTSARVSECPGELDRTSAAVKLEMAKVLNLPALCISSTALRVSWKGVARSASQIR